MFIILDHTVYDVYVSGKFLCLEAKEFKEAEGYELTDRQNEATAQNRHLNIPTQPTTGSSDRRPPPQTRPHPNRSDTHSMSSPTGPSHVYNNFNAQTQTIIYNNNYTNGSSNSFPLFSTQLKNSALNVVHDGNAGGKAGHRPTVHGYA
ncbi:hypothetical protein D9758_008174 [Tetrapyrgos nigripes]|uniref:Uncharacterized protein n=1 Tax=Tetrapyrgos nigripes TaxID=182062 RepID=A0A8H5GHC3_9AGAR|nr:hypothetical protein D9758_008174 [Tetrapyrgos nigripes]